jgi:hypothetical protein
MSQHVQESTRTSFVDFIYAVVVGSTFPFLAPFDASFRLAGLLFLIIVVLEDFYLFHTQIAGKVPDAPAPFMALVMELSVLISWYMAVISFPASPRPCLIAFASFFLCKWLAGLFHFGAIRKLTSWHFQRCHSFLVPFAASLLLAWRVGSDKLSQPVVWITIPVSWLIYVVIWWYVTDKHQQRSDVF